MRVHSTLGPGLREGIYEECLCHELLKAGLPFRRQVHVPIRYSGYQLSTRFRLDFLVDETAIVEVKALEMVLPVHQAQLLTYLRVTGMRLGLLMNFNVRHFRDGLHRRVI